MLKTSRLERLAILLENYREGDDVPKFSLDAWSVTEHRRAGFLWWGTITCHTQACAVGLACLSGEFAADGLSCRLDGNSITPLYRSGEYQKADWYAVEAFFGLTNAESTRLFDGSEYDGAIYGPDAAKAVAARIRELIAPKRTAEAVEKIKAEALAAG